MAVNKEASPRGESVGDKVDAIIIGSMNSQEEDPVIVETPIRRSKRLTKTSDDESKKSKDFKSSPKEKEKKSKDPSAFREIRFGKFPRVPKLTALCLPLSKTPSPL